MNPESDCNYILYILCFLSRNIFKNSSDQNNSEDEEGTMNQIQKIIDKEGTTNLIHQNPAFYYLWDGDEK